MNLGTARIFGLGSFLNDGKKEKYLEEKGREIFALSVMSTLEMPGCAGKNEKTR